VIIGAPTVLTETLIDTYKFDVVVMSLETDNRIGITDINQAYTHAKEKGILKKLEIESPFNKDLIIKRIIDNQEQHL